MSTQEARETQEGQACHICDSVNENNVSDALYCSILGKWYIYGGYGSRVIDNDTLEVRHPGDLKLELHPENENQNPYFCDNCLKKALVRNSARFVIEGGHWCGDEEWKDEYYLVRFHVWKEMKEDGSLFYGQNIKDLKIRKFDREAYLAEKKRVDEIMETIFANDDANPAFRRLMENTVQPMRFSDSVLAKEDEVRHKAEKLIEKIDSMDESFQDQNSIDTVLQEACMVIQEIRAVAPRDFAQNVALLASFKTILSSFSSHEEEISVASD